RTEAMILHIRSQSDQRRITSADVAGGREPTRKLQICRSSAVRSMCRRVVLEPELGLSAEEVLDCLDGYVTADVGDGVGQRDLFGADLDAVLSEAALLDPAIAGERAQAIFLEDFAGGVVV